MLLVNSRNLGLSEVALCRTRKRGEIGTRYWFVCYFALSPELCYGRSIFGTLAEIEAPELRLKQGEAVVQ